MFTGADDSVSFIDRMESMQSDSEHAADVVDFIKNSGA